MYFLSSITRLSINLFLILAEVIQRFGNDIETVLPTSASLATGDLVVVPQDIKNGGYLFQIRMSLEVVGTIGIYVSFSN